MSCLRSCSRFFSYACSSFTNYEVPFAYAIVTAIIFAFIPKEINRETSLASFARSCKELLISSLI